MAEPSLELDGHDEKTAAPTYDIPFINGGTVDATKTLRFAGADSVDGTLTNFQRPASGNAWADDLWDDDSDGADAQLSDENTTPDAATQPYLLFKLTSDAVAFASKPRVTIYDDTGHTEAEEVCVGTVGHTSPFVKGIIGTASVQPAQWWGEASSAALHTLETGGGVESGNNALCGDTNYLQASAVDINGTPQYFSIAMSIPDDAAVGVDVINAVLTIRYTYT